jgi:hypothetical protein
MNYIYRIIYIYVCVCIYIYMMYIIYIFSSCTKIAQLIKHPKTFPFTVPSFPFHAFSYRKYICNFPNARTYDVIFALFTKYPPRVSTLPVPCSGINLITSQTASGYCKGFTFVELESMRYINSGCLLQSCVQLLQQYCVLVRA